MKKFLIGLLCVAGVAYLLGLGVLVVRNQGVVPSQKTVGDVNGVPFTVVDVASSTPVLTSSKQIIGTSTSAQFRQFQNNSGATIYLNFSDVPATVNTGVALFASSTLTYANEGLYRGAVQAIAPSGTPTILIIQK